MSLFCSSAGSVWRNKANSNWIMTRNDAFVYTKHIYLLLLGWININIVCGENLFRRTLNLMILISIQQNRSWNEIYGFQFDGKWLCGVASCVYNIQCIMYIVYSKWVFDPKFVFNFCISRRWFITIFMKYILFNVWRRKKYK